MASGLRLRMTGLENTIGYLSRVGNTARDLAARGIAIGSSKPYAFGIETGYHRGGRLARRAGGAWMLRDGFSSIQGRVRQIYISALMGGKNAGAVASEVGNMVIAAVRPRTPVKSGSLRDSFRVEPR